MKKRWISLAALLVLLLVIAVPAVSTWLPALVLGS